MRPIIKAALIIGGSAVLCTWIWADYKLPAWSGSALAKFIVEMANALAWPTLIGGGALYFRRQIGLLSRALARGLNTGRIKKFGPLEWAEIAPVVAAATEVANAQLQKAQQEVADAPIDDKPAKVEELVQAAKDVATLENYQRLMSSGAQRAGSSNFVGPNERGAINTMLMQVASNVGARDIVEADSAEQIEAMKQHFLAVLNSGAPIHVAELPRFVGSLQRISVLDAGGQLTDIGWEYLVATAKRIHRPS
jgi:hypothetical protein